MSDNNRDAGTNGGWSGECLLASFDILGYKRMIETCASNHVVAERGLEIYKSMEEAKDFAFKFICNIHGKHDDSPEYQKVLTEIIAHTKPYSVSDTIILAMKFSHDDFLSKFKVPLFFLYCSAITYIMCIRGFPVRGAIDYGFCYTKESMSFGKPLLESHILSERIEFSGTVLTEAAKSIYDRYQGVLRSIPKVFTIDVAMKVEGGNVGMVQAHSLDWTYMIASLPAESFAELVKLAPEKFEQYSEENMQLLEKEFDRHKLITIDPVRFVQDAFSRYGKGVEGNGIPEKIKNTVEVMGRMKGAV